MTPSLVHRRPGLLAALITLVVAAVALTVVLVVPGAAAPAPQAGPSLSLPSRAPAVVPGGPEVRDAGAGLRYPLPAGWTPIPGQDFVYGITAGGTLDRPGKGPDPLLMTGVIDGSVFASSEPTAAGAARRLALDFGEFFVPTPGRRESRVEEAVTVDGRPAWSAGYTVVPTSPSSSPTDIRVTVIQDGDRRVFALVIVAPSDAATLAAASATVSAIRFG